MSGRGGVCKLVPLSLLLFPLIPISVSLQLVHFQVTRLQARCHHLSAHAAHKLLQGGLVLSRSLAQQGHSNITQSLGSFYTLSHFLPVNKLEKCEKFCDERFTRKGVRKKCEDNNNFLVILVCAIVVGAHFARVYSDLGRVAHH